MLRNRYFISLIVLLFVAVLIFNINFFSKRLRPFHLKTAVTIPTIKKEKMSEVSSIFPVKKDKSLWRRDPFVHDREGKKVKEVAVKDKVKVSDVKITLQGIMKAKGRFYAIVNGWVVKKGDMIEGMLVEDILRDSILLRDEGKHKVIKLE